MNLYGIKGIPTGDKVLWYQTNGDPCNKAMRMIVPIRLDITSADGTRKLAQNKPDSARIGAADGLSTSDVGSELSALAQLMRETLD